MNLIDEAWANAIERTLSENQLHHVEGFKKALRALTTPGRLANLISGKGRKDGQEISVKDLDFKQEEMNSLEGKIINSASSARLAVTYLQILKKLVLQLNQTNDAKIPLPRRRFVHKPPSNPLPENIAEIRSLVRLFVEIESEWIKRTAPNPPLEQVVLSAILHSGLLSTGSVAAFVNALLSPEKSLRVLPMRVCVELNLEWRGKRNMEFRLLELDDQTAALLRLPDSYFGLKELLVTPIADTRKTGVNAEILKRVFANILAVLSSNGTKSEIWPRTLAQLLDIVSVAARSEMPGVLIDYASRTIIAHSLKPESARAVYGPDSRFSKRTPNEVEPPEAPLADEYEVALKTDEPSFGELLALRKALRTEDPVKMLDQLKEIDSRLPPYSEWISKKHGEEKTPSEEGPGVQFSVWKLMAQFAIHLLTSEDLGDK